LESIQNLVVKAPRWESTKNQKKRVTINFPCGPNASVVGTKNRMTKKSRKKRKMYGKFKINSTWTIRVEMGGGVNWERKCWRGGVGANENSFLGVSGERKKKNESAEGRKETR